MNKIALPLALLGIIGLSACNQQAGTESATTEPETAALDTPEQRLSYGTGYSLGQRMIQDNVPIDDSAFNAGMSDAVNGRESRMTQEEMQTEIQAYQQKAQAEMEAARAEQAEANRAAGEAFLAENGAREGVVTTESGLQYEIIEEGEGPIPGADDTVEVHYTGTLIDGTVFDSSVQRGQTVVFGVGQVIPGWTEALQLMPAGSKWKLFIPSELGYGAGGAGQAIGPNSTLIFDVELLAVPSQEEPAAEEAEASAEG